MNRARIFIIVSLLMSVTSIVVSIISIVAKTYNEKLTEQELRYDSLLLVHISYYNDCETLLDSVANYYEDFMDTMAESDIYCEYAKSQKIAKTWILEKN